MVLSVSHASLLYQEVSKAKSISSRFAPLRSFRNLGISDTYFALESVETIGDHIMALFGAKILAYTKHSNALEIDLDKETEDGAVFIHSSVAGRSNLGGPIWERR